MKNIDSKITLNIHQLIIFKILIINYNKLRQKPNKFYLTLLNKTLMKGMLFLKLLKIKILIKIPNKNLKNN